MISFKVLGEPQPWPKKEIKIVRRGADKVFANAVDRDPKGLKAAWKQRVQDAAREFMKGRDPIPKRAPLCITLVVYRTRAKSNQYRYPVIIPDGDNYFYLVHNVLEGICYVNDSQLCDYHEYKRWAHQNPSGVPGVYVFIEEVTDESTRFPVEL